MGMSLAGVLADRAAHGDGQAVSDGFSVPQGVGKCLRLFHVEKTAAGKGSAVIGDAEGEIHFVAAPRLLGFHAQQFAHQNDVARRIVQVDDGRGVDIEFLAEQGLGLRDIKGHVTDAEYRVGEVFHGVRGMTVHGVQLAPRRLHR